MTARCHQGKPPGGLGANAANDARRRWRSGNMPAIWLRAEELAMGKKPPEMTSRTRKTRLTTVGAASKFGMNVATARARARKGMPAVLTKDPTDMGLTCG
jgi:hypothetical protein